MTDLSQWREALELERKGQYRRARQRLHDCLHSPHLDAPDVHFHIGWCLEADGDSSTALAHYLRAAALAVDGALAANARYRAGLLALGAGDFDQAMSLLEATREASASHQAIRQLEPHAAYWVGVCCEAQNRVLDALEIYDAVARASEPRLRAEARYRRLQGLASIGAFHAAIRVAGDLIESDDGSDERIAQLAELAAEEKRQLLLALKDA